MSGTTLLDGRREGILGVRMPVIATFAALVIAVLAVYRETALGMIQIWSRSETFNHCYLILPIVLWLVWQRRATLQTMTATPSAWALVLLAVGGSAWLAGSLARVDALTHFALVGVLVSLVPLVFGTAISRHIAFPLAFMFLAVPFGEFAMPWMMDRTADFTVGALALSGVPVYREGLHFVIPSGNWSVIEACSGVRYLIASFTVGSLFAYLNYRSTAKRLVFVGVSILVPILANWLRAYMIVMLGHLSNNRLAVGVDHIIYGWVFFGVVIIIMFAIGSRFTDDPDDGEAAASVASAEVRNPGLASLAKRCLPALAFIVLPMQVSHHLLAANVAAVPMLAPATNFGTWAGAPLPAGSWAPAFERPKREWQARFSSRAGHVDVYVGYYRAQSDGGKVVGSQSVLVRTTDEKWLQSGVGRISARLAGREQDLRTAQLVNVERTVGATGQRLLVWYLYWVDGAVTASEVEVKARLAWSMIRGRGDDAAVLVFSTPAGTDAPARLQDFLDAAGSGLVDTVAQVRRTP